MTSSIIARSAVVHVVLLCCLMFLPMACGSGGGGGGTAAGVNNSQVQEANALIVTTDEYGLLSPNFYYSVNNNALWSIQSNRATDIWDPNFLTIIRIDITKTDGVMPAINKSFSIENGGKFEKFPGTFTVFNGQASVLKKVEQGTIVFSADSNPSGIVYGMFSVILTDYDSVVLPTPQYHLSGTFYFTMGTYGPAN